MFSVSVSTCWQLIWRNAVRRCISSVPFVITELVSLTAVDPSEKALLILYEQELQIYDDDGRRVSTSSKQKQKRCV